jgi:N-acyl-D-aspartate/D-glutamate deacylase
MLALTASCLALVLADAPVEADVVLRGGTLIDGTGKPGVVGDLAVKGDRIVAVGKFPVAGSPKVIDCAGLVVAPGFIDLHTHSDGPLQSAATRDNLNYLRQGVTTVVTGNCGSGPVDVAAFFQKLEQGGVGSNVIHQVPHNNVRERVMGNANRSPTADELHRMEELTDKAMRDGAWGLSTGLIYNPGTYAKTDEIIALAKVAARHGGFYASHIRNEGVNLLTSIEEALTVGREAGLPVHISHLKALGRASWNGRAADAVALIQKARAAGQAVTADQYPYTASSTSLRAMVVPTRFTEGSQKEYVKRLDDPELGPRIRAAVAETVKGMQNGKDLRIARYATKPAWNGRDIASIAAEEKQEPADVVLEIERHGGAGMIHFGMNEEDVRLIMKQPFVATASDGGAKKPDDSMPHPRSYGTFPRKIAHYAIEEGVVPLEQAVRSASGLPADVLRLTDRGYLKAGAFADVVAFDPKAFRDVATFAKPHEYAEGVRSLYVNGQAVIDGGTFTGKLAGRVLRHREPAVESGGGR